MFDRFTDRSKKLMNLARQEAQRFNHEYLGTEHILLGLAALDGGTALDALKRHGIERARIREEIARIVRPGPAIIAMAQLPFTPRAKKVLEFAMAEASNLGHNYIGTEHILLGMIAEREGIAAQVLQALGLGLDDARRAVVEILGLGVEDDSSISPADGSATYSRLLANAPFRERSLVGYCFDTAPRTEALVAREAELELLGSVLTRSTDANAMLVGPAGAGKSALLHGFVQRVSTRALPGAVCGRRCVTVSWNGLLSGLVGAPAFAVRFRELWSAARGRPNVVLAFDPMPMLARVPTEPRADEVDALHAFLEVLATGGVPCIATALPEAWEAFGRSDPALARRFTPVHVAPSDAAVALAVLGALRERFERHHRAQFTTEALETAVQLSERAFPGRVLPGRAVDLLDQSAALAAARADSPPLEEQALHAVIAGLEREKDQHVAQQDFPRAVEARNSAASMRRELDTLVRERTRSRAPITVDDADVRVCAERLAPPA